MSDVVCRRLGAAAADDEVLVGELAGVINRAYALGESGLWLGGWSRITADEVAEAIRGGDMLVATSDASSCAPPRS